MSATCRSCSSRDSLDRSHRGTNDHRESTESLFFQKVGETELAETILTLLETLQTCRETIWAIGNGLQSSRNTTQWFGSGLQFSWNHLQWSGNGLQCTRQVRNEQ